MKRIFLIRHGESEWNKINKIQGQKNVNLTKKGIVGAHKIGNRLISKNIDAIYSSHLHRAKNTADIIGEKIKLPINIIEDIQEISFGTWEGMTGREVEESYKEELNSWRKNPEKMRIKGGETLEELQIRAMSAIDIIIDDDNLKNIAIVSHGATLKTIILGLLDMDLCHFKNLTLSNVGLTTVEFRDYNRVLRNLNDISHLKES